MKGQNIFLKPEEGMFLGMSIASMLEDLEAGQDQRINWTPEARKVQKEMFEAGKGVKIKFERLGIKCNPLPPFEDGDEKEFLTKIN